MSDKRLGYVVIMISLSMVGGDEYKKNQLAQSQQMQNSNTNFKVLKLNASQPIGRIPSLPINIPNKNNTHLYPEENSSSSERRRSPSSPTEGISHFKKRYKESQNFTCGSGDSKSPKSNRSNQSTSNANSPIGQSPNYENSTATFSPSTLVATASLLAPNNLRDNNNVNQLKNSQK